jgi:hypothetical protein
MSRVVTTLSPDAVFIVDNFTNVTFPTINDFLNNWYGVMAVAAYVIEWLNATAIIITGVVGVALNITSLLVFNRKEFNIPLYVFLRVYCVVGMLICAISITFPFFNNRILFFTTSTTVAAQTYVGQAYTYVSFFLIAITFLLDIVIVLDRIATFNSRVKKWFTRFSARQISAACVIFSIVFCFPVAFSNGLYWKDIYSARTGELIRIFLVSTRTTLSNHVAGIILLNFIYVCRNLVTLAADLALNFVSAYYFRMYAVKKNQLVKAKAAATTTGGNQSQEQQARTAKLESKTSNFKAEKKATQLVITLSCISIVNKLILNVSFFLPYFTAYGVHISVMFYITNNFNTLRHVLSVITFYYFNKNFRNSLKDMFGIARKVKVAVDASTTGGTKLSTAI